MPRVALVFGGRTVEHRVSVVSARTVARALTAAGHQVVGCGISRGGAWLGPEQCTRALAGTLDELPETAVGDAPAALLAGVDAAFPIVHGTWGEDGSLQGLLEMLDVPYVGAGVAASAVAMDKRLCKLVLRSAGVPVVDFESVRRDEVDDGLPERLERLAPPLFVKPSVGGSSVGIRRVAERSELGPAVRFALQFDDAVIVESAVAGRELECSVLGYPRLEASRVGEIVPGNEFYDYADKYLGDAAELRIPAPLDAGVEAELRQLAIAAFAAIGGTSMARVDFFLDADGRAVVNEINTLPGFTGISMYPKLWEASGLDIAALVDRLVSDALARHEDRRRLNVGIREWLDELA